MGSSLDATFDHLTTHWPPVGTQNGIFPWCHVWPPDHTLTTSWDTEWDLPLMPRLTTWPHTDHQLGHRMGSSLDATFDHLTTHWPPVGTQNGIFPWCHVWPPDHTLTTSWDTEWDLPLMPRLTTWPHTDHQPVADTLAWYLERLPARDRKWNLINQVRFEFPAPTVKPCLKDFHLKLGTT